MKLTIYQTLNIHSLLITMEISGFTVFNWVQLTHKSMNAECMAKWQEVSTETKAKRNEISDHKILLSIFITIKSDNWFGFACVYFLRPGYTKPDTPHHSPYVFVQIADQNPYISV